MLFPSFAALGLVGAALASTVTVHTPQQGQFVGHSLEFGDQFYGIPYAEPPLGDLRFDKTVAAKPSDGVREALLPGAACMQPLALVDEQNPYSEDCLFLNIYRPPIASREALLPVIVFIHGGSWGNGSSTEPTYNATDLITRSVHLGEPVLVVTPNYRIGLFGFLAGPAITKADKAGTAALNPGYWDQRMALRWVQDNIASFGGDPTRVTLAGQSAGANSVAAQMLADGGKTEGLFRAAIMQSGSQGLSPRFHPTSWTRVFIYGLLLAQTKCWGLKCLREKSAMELLEAHANMVRITSVPALFVPCQDHHFVETLASAQFASGKFPDLPVLTGSVLDEGTTFSPDLVPSNTAFSFNVLAFTGGAAVLPRLKEVQRLYPDDPSLGAPFNMSLFGINGTDRLIEPRQSNQYRRMSAFFTDVWLDAGRHQQLRAIAPRANAWNYLFAQPDPSTMLEKPEMGVYHGSELPFVFARPPAPFTGEVVDEPTAAAAKYAGPADIQRTSDLMSAAWIHFANNMSPAGEDVPEWPTYGSEAKSLQIQGVQGTRVIKDDARKEPIDFVLQHASSFLI